MDKERLETIADMEGKRRTKTILIIIGLAGGAILLSFAYTAISFFNVQKQLQQKAAVKQEALAKEDIEKSWKTHFERRLNGQAEEISRIQQKVEKLEKKQEEINGKLDTIIDALNQLQKEQSLVKMQVEEAKANKWKPPVAPPIAEKTAVNNKKEIPPPISRTAKPEVENKFYSEEPAGREEKKEKKEIIEFKPKKSANKKQEKKTSKILRIPMGFATGITLTGSDFPTLQYGRNNPHPIFISIESRQILANNKKLNLKECFVLGSGWGELSSERAYILLDKISCTTKDGKLLEAQIHGWVMDDDGKVGLRGRLVTKQGAYLGRSVIAGFLSGISRILSASATTVQISPIGTTSTVSPSDALKVGMYSGIGNAAERLAKFYEKMAEEIFPVIEVNGGRRVVLAFDTNGIIRLTEKKLELNPLEGEDYELGSIKLKRRMNKGGSK